MKNSCIRFLVLILTLVGFSPAAFAADANLTFASSVSSSSIGSDIKITVNASIAGFNAASTTFKVTYDPNMLEYQSHSGSGSGFPLEFSEPDVANGTITHSRGKTGSGVTGNVKVVEYTFKAKNNGSTTVRFGPSQIWESGTGIEKSLDTSATVNLTFSSQQQSSTSTPTPNQSSSGSSSTPKPKVTAKPATPRPTATPTSTARPTAATTSTPTATATPASGAASASQSTVTLNATSAVANGTDKIDVNVIVRDEKGTVLTNVEPAFAGLRDGDTATPFVFDAVTQSWSASLSSTTPGTLFLTVSAGSVDLANQDIAFTGSSTPTPTQTTGSSFTTIILVGFLILLILLLVLFFIWRRLKSHDDDHDSGNDDSGAFPGDEGTTVPVDTVTKPSETAPSVEAGSNEDVNARLNQDAILQRGGPPPVTPEEKPSDDDSIPV